MFTRVASSLLIAVVIAAGARADGSAPLHTARRAARDALRLELHLRGAASAAELEAALLARSTPGSPLFRRHMTAAEVRALTAAPKAQARRVAAALNAAGCAAGALQTFSTGDVVVCTDLPPAAAARLGLAPRVSEAHEASTAAFTADGTPRELAPGAFRVDAPVPAGLRADVGAAIVSRGSVLYRHRQAPARRQRLGAPVQPLGDIANKTPEMIARHYRIPTTPVRGVPASFSVGAAEYQDSYFQMTDIDGFAASNRLPSPIIRVHGPNQKSYNDVEGTMDLEFLMGVSGGHTPTWWLADKGINFAHWAEGVLAMGEKAPKVISISWGAGYLQWKVAVMDADNRAFMKLGLTGTTVLIASGDSGPGGRGVLPPSQCRFFDPAWPAASPWVTAVGATHMDSAGSEEMTVNWSGGGFSPDFGRPAYQAAAVEGYLTSQASRLPMPYFNHTGRAFPDISAFGTKYNSMIAGNWMQVGGTSCSTPSMGSLFGRLNAERLAAGKPLLGFLNPALYKLGKVGTDITKGATINTQCQDGAHPGFPAAKGWDATSGLGAPDYEFLTASL